MSGNDSDRDTQLREPGRGTGPIHAVLRGIVWVGQASAWIILPILVLVLIGVTLSILKIGTVVSWENNIFLLGSKLSIASIGDLQWHLFGIMLMLSLAGTLVSDRHVRVDMLRQHMSDRVKNLVDLVGHLIFLLPFASVVAFHGFDFALRAFKLGEGSDYDGLYDRFLIKSFIPIGFTLMVLAGLGLVFLLIRSVLRDKQVDHGIN